ncbi:ABC transporter ATP-binding protein [Paracoccaceae bacterium Fryx2]|nr:ABC transporter ATP-binding protein [Paracoccaceae bacterium Fryx2]
MTQADDIVVDAVSKPYGRHLALDQVSLRVRSGSVFALLGPNGAGKSTLIDILCTIRAPDDGSAQVNGLDVVRQSRKVRREIGVVFQDPTLDTRLTVRENLNFHGMVYQRGRADRHRRIDELLALVELENWRDAVVRTLSSGMKRRLEIARALMHEPRVLFLDEPTVGLDAQARAGIWSYLDTLRKNRPLTVVVTTHYIDEVESCDHVSIIDHGKIIAEGTPDALKADHGRLLVRARPASAAVGQAIRARHPGVLDGAGGLLLIPLDDPAALDALQADFGPDLRHITIDQPSLENVFLSLTGRDLREGAPASRRGRPNGR